MKLVSSEDEDNFQNGDFPQFLNERIPLWRWEPMKENYGDKVFAE